MGSQSSVLISLFRSLFGCSHSRTTFPTTRVGVSPDGKMRSQTRVTCLNCGEELPYDWQKMEIEGGGARGGLFRWLRNTSERITGHHSDQR
jgi:RNase P subunit RPR2